MQEETTMWYVIYIRHMAYIDTAGLLKLLAGLYDISIIVEGPYSHKRDAVDSVTRFYDVS